MAILTQHLRREMGALAGWSLALAALVVLQTSLYRALASGTVASELRTALHGLPPQLVQFVGGSLNLFSANGWLGAIDLSGWITLIAGIWLALAAVSVVASDVDQRTLEFMLSLPVQRGRLLFERSLSLVLQLALLYLVIYLAALLGLAVTGEHANSLRFAAAMGLVLLDQVALAGTLVLVSLFFRDQTYAMLATVTAAAVFIFIPVFVEPSSSLGFIRHLTPFDYGVAGGLMLHGTYPASNIVLSAIWAVVAFLAAFAVFARQEV